MIFTIAKQKTLDDAAKVGLQQLQLNLLERKKTTVNGMLAISTLSNQISRDRSTGQQQTIKVLSYFIDYNGIYYVFHGLSAQTDFNIYSGIFEPTMVNFDKLTESSILNVQSKRIRIKNVQHAGTLADALRSFGIQQEQMEEFAFLNNMELTDQVPAGALIKIVGD